MMTLLPEEVKKQLPPLHTQDALPDRELYAYARLTFEPLGFTWFLLELDREDQDTFSAYLIDPDKEQFGYFSFAYLEERLAVMAVNVIGDAPGEETIVSMEEVPFTIAYDPTFTPKSPFEAVQEERRIRKGKGLRETDTLASHRAYYYAAKYSQPAQAKQAFAPIRDMVQREEMNLSVFTVPPGVYALQWTIVVIGDRPPEPIHTRIMDILQEGTFTTIPYDLLMQGRAPLSGGRKFQGV